MSENLFGTETPALTDNSDGVDYALGVRFTASADGQITHGRWRSPETVQNNGATFGLYKVSDQSLLASKDFGSVTLGDWNSLALDTPVDITADTTYAAVVWISSHYCATTGYTWPHTSGSLTAIADNGWLTSSPGALAFPSTESGNAANFFVDIEFTASTPGAIAPDGITVPITIGQPALSQTFTITPTGITVPITLGRPALSQEIAPVTETGGSWEGLRAGVAEARAAHAEAERRRRHPIDCPEHLWPLQRTASGEYHCLFGGHVVEPY